MSTHFIVKLKLKKKKITLTGWDDRSFSKAQNPFA